MAEENPSTPPERPASSTASSEGEINLPGSKPLNSETTPPPQAFGADGLSLPNINLKSDHFSGERVAIHPKQREVLAASTPEKPKSDRPSKVRSLHQKRLQQARLLGKESTKTRKHHEQYTNLPNNWSQQPKDSKAPKKLAPHPQREREQRGKQLRRQREQKQQRHKLNKLRSFLRLVFACLVLAGLVAGFRWVGWQAELAESTISLLPSWLSKTPADLILQATLPQTEKPKPLWLIHPKSIQSALQEAYPVAGQVWVRRLLFPARVTVGTQVTSEPWALLYATQTQVSLETDATAARKAPVPIGLLLSNHQPVFPFTPSIDLAALQRIPGLLPIQVAPDLLTSTDDNTQEAKEAKLEVKPFNWKKLRAIIRFTENRMKQSVEWVRVTRGHRVKLGFKGLEVKVGLLDDTVFKRMERLPIIYSTLEQQREPVSMIDLRWERNAFFTRPE